MHLVRSTDHTVGQAGIYATVGDASPSSSVGDRYGCGSFYVSQETDRYPSLDDIPQLPVVRQRGTEERGSCSIPPTSELDHRTRCPERTGGTD
jgi:hypothetical protein